MANALSFGEVRTGCSTTGRPLSVLKYQQFYMINISISIKLDERPCKECKEAAQAPVFVRGHFRMVGNKKVYVKAHYRHR